MGKKESKQNNIPVKIILDLCGGTGSWSRPYREAGYDVRVITFPEYNVNNIDFGNLWITFFSQNGKEDMKIKYSDIYGILAAPPCTMFSFARTTAKTPRDFKGAMRIVKACLDIVGTVKILGNGQLKFWAMENPTGYLRRFIGKPCFKFYQWQFGGYHVKSTDIWGYFNEPTPTVKTKPILKKGEIDKRWSNPTIPDYIKEQLKSVGERRAAVRAITPEGFARAFYRANK
jgi:site-specific DNA-cytosine methylase